MLYQLVLVVHTLVALAIIVLVFLQHGKGADIGATFGGGASNTVFGSQGSGGVLYKATCVLAFCFCVTSISLTAILAKNRRADLGVFPTSQTSQVDQIEKDNSDVPNLPAKNNKNN
ncbi:MAG: preprotein translocase subunit SecG [Gammaproteobacteria bacterium]|nr:preprotein translocase subunit SecG [Gammaproteobacteria bacterium]